MAEGTKNTLRTVNKTIDDLEVKVTIFAGLRGLKLKGRLVRFIGPSIGKALGSLKIEKGKKIKSIGDLEIGMEVFGDGLSKLSERLDEPETVDLIMDLLKSTWINNEEVGEATFNKVFAGNYTTLYKILGFVIETNCFFGKRSFGDLFQRA